MMFPKKNSSCGGEPLCKTCKFGYPTMEPNEYACVWDKSIYENVGICKDYEGVTNG